MFQSDYVPKMPSMQLPLRALDQFIIVGPHRDNRAAQPSRLDLHDLRAHEHRRELRLRQCPNHAEDEAAPQALADRLAAWGWTVNLDANEVKAVSLPVIGDGRSLLTHSRMQCGKTCHRKEHFRYELGLRRKRKAVPLRMGAAIHHGIDLWSKSTDEGVAVFEATAEYAERPAWCHTNEELEDWLTEAEIVRRLLMGYFWRWQDDGLEIVSSEEVFVLPIINPETGRTTPSFEFAGKWDGIVRLPDGRLAVKETKTVGEDIAPDSDYWRRLQMDQQISGYMLAARTKGHDVQTVLYDCIRKPSIRPKNLTKADRTGLASTKTYFGEHFEFPDGQIPERETAALFGARLGADMGERPEFYFARVEIPRLQSDIEEFRQELWEMQLDLRNRQKTQRFYRNTSACLTMGKCEFFEVCTSRWEPKQGVPSGFEIVQNVHPELVEVVDENA